MPGTEVLQPDRQGLFVILDGLVALARFGVGQAEIVVLGGNVWMLRADALQVDRQSLFEILDGFVVLVL